MKKIFLLLLIGLCFSIVRVEAKGGIPILYSNGEEIEKLLDLPHKDEFEIQANNGNWYHANLGIMHEQFSVFWIPLFNYGEEKYVLYTDTKIGDYDYTYVELDKDDIAYIQSEVDGVPTDPELPFWDAWGGKLLVLAIIGIFWFIAKLD